MSNTTMCKVTMTFYYRGGILDPEKLEKTVEREVTDAVHTGAIGSPEGEKPGYYEVEVKVEEL